MKRNKKKIINKTWTLIKKISKNIKIFIYYIIFLVTFK